MNLKSTIEATPNTVISLLSTLLGLIFFNSWFFDLSLGSYDLLSGHVTILSEFIKNGGPENTIYSFRLLGGAEVYPNYGILPIQRLLLILFSKPIIIASLTTLFIIVLNTFTLRLLFRELYFHYFNEELNLTKYMEIMSTLLLVFIPSLAWRINHGHVNILNGVAAIGLCFVVPLIIYHQRVTIYSLAMIFLGVTHLLPYSSYQMLIYSFIFIAPFWLVYIIATLIEKRVKEILTVIASIIFSVLAVIPSLSLSVNYFAGGKGERSVGELQIFSYLKPDLKYLESSLGMYLERIPESYKSFAHHEINYPISFVLILLFFFCIYENRKSFKKASLFILPSVLAVVFAFDIFGLTSILVQKIKVLGAFRVPYRVLILLNITLIVQVLLFLLRILAKQSVDIKRAAATIIGILFLTITDLKTSEYIGILIVIFSITLFKLKKMNSKDFALISLTFLVGLNINAFTLRFKDKVAIKQVGKVLESLSPEALKLKEGQRIITNIRYDKFTPNLLVQNGYSVLNGYWHPNSSFNEMYSYIFGYEHTKTRLVFSVDPNKSGFDIFKRLYGLESLVGSQMENGTNKIYVNNIGNIKSIWSPKRVVLVKSRKGIAEKLLSKVEDQNYIYENLITTKKIEIAGQCDEVKIQGIRQGKLKFYAKNKMKCVVVLPYNQSQYFIAKSGAESLDIIRAYGAITAVELPPGERTVTLEAINPYSFAKPLSLTGYIGFILMLSFLFRRNFYKII